MFRKRTPQASLFGTSNLVPAAKAKRLQASWAEVFRSGALPLIDEELWRRCIAPTTGARTGRGRPCSGCCCSRRSRASPTPRPWSSWRVNLQWPPALGLTPEEAHLPQKTLHNFRARLLAQDRGQQAFQAITDRLLQALGTKVTRQRLDSTQVMSNMAVLTRRGLLWETIRPFLKTLASHHPRLSGRVPARLRRRYLKEDGGATAYQDAPFRYRAETAVGVRSRPVPTSSTVGGHVGRELAVLRFAATPVGRAMRHRRGPTGSLGGRRRRRRRRRAGDPQSGPGRGRDSLQSPYDAEATYNARKGKGYAVQIAETCVETPDETPDEEDLSTVNLITHVEVTDACASDEHATMPVLEALDQRGQRPDELVAEWRSAFPVSGATEPGRGRLRRDRGPEGGQPRPPPPRHGQRRLPRALSHSRRHRGHGLGVETKTRAGRPARARALAGGAGRLPESPGLQCQENGAGLGPPLRRPEPGQGLRKGAGGSGGPENGPASPGPGPEAPILRVRRLRAVPSRFVAFRSLKVAANPGPPKLGFLRGSQVMTLTVLFFPLPITFPATCEPTERSEGGLPRPRERMRPKRKWTC